MSRVNRSTKQGDTTTFQGFEHPDANFVYCPNQFFDVCLPNNSSGVVRIVAYMLRKTLGFLDEHGNPIETEIEVSRSDLISNAGISNGCIPDAIDEALSGCFISRVRSARRSTKGQPAQSAFYKLCWNEESDYTTDQQSFQGFFAGVGNCSPIPNAFFDQIVPHENLTMIKVVGTVLRYTVGFESKYGGGRREQAALTYDFIQSVVNVKNRTTLRDTLKDAVKRPFIRVAAYGSFDSNGGKGSRPTEYAVHWLTKAQNIKTSPKNVPEQSDHAEKRTGSSPKNVPVNLAEKRTGIKTVTKDIPKQQQTPVAVVGIENTKGYGLLLAQGFDSETASRLAQLRSFEVIENQISWLPLRKIDENPMGLLVRAIEKNYSDPTKLKTEAKQKTGQQETQRDIEQKAEAAAVKKQEQEQTAMLADRKKEWSLLSDHHKSHYRDLTLKQITSHSARARIRKNHSFQSPAPEVLAVMAESCETAGVVSS